jgi:hypothetical protein
MQPPLSFLQTMEEYVADAPAMKDKVWKLLKPELCYWSV